MYITITNNICIVKTIIEHGDIAKISPGVSSGHSNNWTVSSSIINRDSLQRHLGAGSSVVHTWTVLCPDSYFVPLILNPEFYENLNWFVPGISSHTICSAILDCYSQFHHSRQPYWLDTKFRNH